MMRYGFLIFVVLALAGLGGAAAWKHVQLAGSVDKGGGGRAALAVAAAAVADMSFSDVVEALGTARAAESVTLTSKATDIISRVAFESGDVVAADQVLVEFAAAEESADLREVREAFAETEREYARFKDLAERGVASKQRIDELASAVERAHARMRSVEARLADRIIRAPFPGVVGLRNASKGMLVRPGDPIATLDDISVIKVDFTVPEVFLGVLKQGQPLSVASAAYPDETFAGDIADIDSRVDPVTRAATVRAEIANADGRLRPGMLMLVDVRRNIRTSPAVPELAVLREGETAFVYVIEEAKGGLVAGKRIVKTGARRDGKLEVVDGLKTGERVISEGVHRVRPGQPVVIPDAGASGASVSAQGRGA